MKIKYGSMFFSIGLVGIMLVIFVSSISAQPDLGKKQYLHYATGEVKSEWQYANGLLEGPMNHYSRDGQLKESLFYRNGKKNGTAKVYYADGNVFQELNYSEDKLKGLIKAYYPSGTISEVAQYEDGLRNGKYNAYFEDGNVRIEGDYDKGVCLDCRQFYKKGILRMRVGLIGNKKDGVFTEYYVSGELFRKGKFKNDVLLSVDGFDRDENIVFSEKDGVKNGTYMYFHDNGILSEKINYRVGEKNGVSKYFYDNGRLWLVENYKNDRREGEIRAYFPDGIKKIEGDFQSGTCELKEFYSGGALRKHIQCDQGGQRGEYKEFYSDGTLKAQGRFDGDMLTQENIWDGEYSEYFPSGAIQTITVWKNGKKEGSAKQYNSSGDLKQVLVFKDDDLVEQSDYE